MRTRRDLLTAAMGFSAGVFGTRTATAEAKTQVVTLLNGRGSPARRLGIVGDFYVDYRHHKIYGPKRRSGWGRPTSLIGPPGPAGPTGLTTTNTSTTPQVPAAYEVLNGDGPPAASVGVDDDFYVDTSTTQLYGPKAGGAWGAPISLTGGANITVIDGGRP